MTFRHYGQLKTLLVIHIRLETEDVFLLNTLANRIDTLHCGDIAIDLQRPLTAETVILSVGLHILRRTAQNPVMPGDGGSTSTERKYETLYFTSYYAFYTLC